MSTRKFDLNILKAKKFNKFNQTFNNNKKNWIHFLLDPNLLQNKLENVLDSVGRILNGTPFSKLGIKFVLLVL